MDFSIKAQDLAQIRTNLTTFPPVLVSIIYHKQGKNVVWYLFDKHENWINLPHGFVKVSIRRRVINDVWMESEDELSKLSLTVEQSKLLRTHFEGYLQEMSLPRCGQPLSSLNNVSAIRTIFVTSDNYN